MPLERCSQCGGPSVGGALSQIYCDNCLARPTQAQRDEVAARTMDSLRHITEHMRAGKPLQVPTVSLEELMELRIARLESQLAAYQAELADREVTEDDLQELLDSGWEINSLGNYGSPENLEGAHLVYADNADQALYLEAAAPRAVCILLAAPATIGQLRTFWRVLGIPRKADAQ